MDNLTASEAYPAVAAAIRYIQNEAKRQPDLADVAEHTGYSPQYLQRMFSQWAGISPKRFLQFLTKEFARQQLQLGRDVLSVSLDSGLSSPGRLHDLIVAMESVTPGELATGGKGIQVRWGYADSPLGKLLGGVTDRGVCFLRFVSDDGESAYDELASQWYGASLYQDDSVIEALTRKLFQKSARSGSISVLVKGTNFQIKVWEALLEVPPGHRTSYGDLATRAGSPGASRAVGTAMAANQLALLIPCHRVIRENGISGQYRWGTERKAALLMWEMVQHTPN